MKSILQSSNGVRVSDWNNLEYCRLLHCPKLSKSEVHHRYSWLQKCIYILCVCVWEGVHVLHVTLVWTSYSVLGKWPKKQGLITLLQPRVNSTYSPCQKYFTRYEPHMVQSGTRAANQNISKSRTVRWNPKVWTFNWKLLMSTVHAHGTVLCWCWCWREFIFL